MTQLELPLSHLTAKDVQLLVKAGILHPVRATLNSTVIEYELTHAGRLLLERTNAEVGQCTL